MMRRHPTLAAAMLAVASLAGRPVAAQRPPAVAAPPVVVASKPFGESYLLAEMFAQFADFAFYRIALKGAHLVAGFGRIVDLPPDDVLTAGHCAYAEPVPRNRGGAAWCRIFAVAAATRIG